MNFSDLESEGIERIGRHLGHVGGKAAYFPIVPADPGRGATLRQHLKAGRVANSPLLQEAQKIADKTALEIRKLRKRAGDLTPEQRREYELKINSNAIQAMEGVVTKQIESLLNDFDTRRKEYEANKTNRDYTKTTNALLTLEELKLRHAFTDETQATVLLGRMAKSGYSEHEALLLASKGKQAYTKMKELFTELPPYLADENGITKLNEVKALLALQPGQLPYHFKTEDGTVNVENKIHVMDLIEQTAPAPSFEEIVK